MAGKIESAPVVSLDKIKVAVKSDDIVLRDPVTKTRVTTDGMVVKRTPFWIRRIKAGDVILIQERNL